MANTNTVAPATTMQLIEVDHSHMFSITSDEKVMVKQIQATHTTNARVIDVTFLLQKVKSVLLDHDALAQRDALEVIKIKDADFTNKLKSLAHAIHKISCEISCKCSGGEDAHAPTVTLFFMLSNYKWDAKVILALVAFANYGKFWSATQFSTKNHSDKFGMLLEHLPDIMDNSISTKPRFDALYRLIEIVLEVSNDIIRFKELQTQHASPDSPVLSDHIPTAAYWTIRSVVACATQQAWVMNDLPYLEKYRRFVPTFERSYKDNLKNLEALITAKDEKKPLIDSQKETKVSIDVLRRKIVLLLISDLDISDHELKILERIFNEMQKLETEFKVVWLPIVDRQNIVTDANYIMEFDDLPSTMPWYKLYDPLIPLTDVQEKKFDELVWYKLFKPSLLDSAVVKYIKENWNFNKRPLLVALDTEGKLICPNAINMTWIWGTKAFPFPSKQEEELWKEEGSWRLELLVYNIYPTVIPTWIDDGKFICLYGGEDIEWIRKFTREASSVAKEISIPLEMIYVGKSKANEQVDRIVDIINKENLSHCLPDLTSIRYFWLRLESMWCSRMQRIKIIEKDPIVPEILKIFTFDTSNQPWVMIGKGSTKMFKANGNTGLKCFESNGEWKGDVHGAEDFLPVIEGYIQKNPGEIPCNFLELPGATWDNPESVPCAQCNRPMKKSITYRCCHD
ncbi:hypothetical protein HHK36_029524 [Tetracentron sinense]|uniref:Uncharacterized protein n=1 Tax=Tetracentron sinense TaxID=13715 RepID=A0A835CZF0_TETSI|nr:hypothetical protein HHK36_029524 [Tetracentron sinense]